MNAASPINVKDFAERYIGHGFRVMPVHSVTKNDGRFVCSCYRKAECTSPGKHPISRLVPNGLKNASADPAIVTKWFGGFGSRNIGIVTGDVSGIVVLDIDARHGGYESLAILEQKHGPLPETLRFKTGGGGEHILFRHPGDRVPNSAGLLGEGIDVRGDGGYIVAPPSLHISGNHYHLGDDRKLDMPLAALPPWLHRLMRQHGGHASGKLNAPTIASLVSNILPEGQRNTNIARISGHLLAKGIDPRICLNLMLTFNAIRCSPPLSDAEVAQIVASIDRRAFNQLIAQKKGT